ncbi:MerR family transcriptional regulator [Amaricoccus macauensis]|uniref:MerR family transcriptional regulator n=1 Tax=Amaricoccus macauensis TaxID=57001 RepID=UPI003C7D616E
MEELYSITHISRELGVTPRTIRYYEEQGLIAPQRAGATRVFTQRDRGRLILILRGKRLGFSLKDIQEYLDLYDADPTQHAQTNVLLTKVRQRIRELEDQLSSVNTALEELREIEDLAADALEGRRNGAASG